MPFRQWVIENKSEIDYHFNNVLKKMKIKDMRIVNLDKFYHKWTRLCYNNSFIPQKKIPLQM